MSNSDGLLAVGGDLSPVRLLNAYANGIFPWYSEGEPIMWWSSNPRMVLFPNQLHVSRSMKRVLNKNEFQVTLDRDFHGVIHHCRKLRKENPGTWITPDMMEAFNHLHELGFAHSVEVWWEERLVGGLYGISLGRCFFAESMFHTRTNASKVAFIAMSRALRRKGFKIMDCQMPTAHLLSLGAREISRKHYLAILDKGLKPETVVGNWGDMGFLEPGPGER